MFTLALIKPDVSQNPTVVGDIVLMIHPNHPHFKGYIEQLEMVHGDPWHGAGDGA